MSFSRIKYDNNAYNEKINRETGEGNYRLFKGYNESCNRCISYDGPRNAKSDKGIAKIDSCAAGNTELCELTFVESLLQNRVHQLIDSNDYGKNDEYKNYPIINQPICSNVLDFEDTRFTYPLEVYRCMDTTEYHYNPYLSTNPQCEIQEDRIGSNTRLISKDSWQYQWRKQKHMIMEQPDMLGIANNSIDNNNTEINYCK